MLCFLSSHFSQGWLAGIEKFNFQLLTVVNLCDGVVCVTQQKRSLDFIISNVAVFVTFVRVT